MLDPETDLIPQSSPSISSSVSSSDLDTESTGSFFHDRSTTLGTLMGLNFPSISIRVSSRRENNANANANANATNAGTDTTTTASTTTTTTSSNVRGGMRKKSKKKVVVIEAAADRRKRWWWKLCRDEVETTGASLGEFLQVERRYEERAFYSATEEAAAFEFETVLNQQGTENNNGNGNGNGGSSSLFADGKVLPPPYTEVVGRPSVDGGGVTVRRFPVLLTGICSGGGTSD